MPKASRGSPTAGLSKNNSTGMLKRNQACHQCRKRKLKCDAKRPCSTCVRSHSHALAHAQEGSHVSPYPECTFDDVPDVNHTDTSKNRHEHLESRILELEALLREKEDATVSFAGSSVDPPQHSIFSSLTTPDVQVLSPVVLAPVSVNFDTSGTAGYINPFILNGDSVFGTFEDGFVGNIPTELDLLWPKWPQHLPRPDLLRHIVDAFFSLHPHATRLLNMPTFLTALSLPFDHPDFPSPAVLHAVCAAGSLYTVANQQQLRLSVSDFAEQQVMHAKNQIDKHLMDGQQPLQCLQATIILSWYYWSHARWIELFVSTGQSLRIAVPLGLNMCPPFHALNTTAKSTSIIPPPVTFEEDETRRNAFWLAYTVDRQYSAGNGWAMSLDDNDIAQLLPLPKAKLDAGIPVAAEHRQWSHLPESFLVHPPDSTDSFTLYIKVMMIISRIKNFNQRFRVMENIGEPGSKCTRMNRWNEPDVRSTTTFNQLDNLVISFRSSLSREFKDPFINTCVDPHLYTTHLALHASIILLHEPHSKVNTSICTSAMKILHAARGILELLYAVFSTNYALEYLDPFCPFCWFLAGRVFGRYLQAAQDASSIQQIETLQGELEFIRTALGKMGERVPLSARYKKMLDTCIPQARGSSVALTLPTNAYSKPVRTVVDDSLLSRVTQTQIPAIDLWTFAGSTVIL